MPGLPASSNFTASQSRQWGTEADVPVPGDYDGDGKTDVAVWRPSDGTWYVRKSSSNYVSTTQTTWGASGDAPIPQNSRNVSVAFEPNFCTDPNCGGPPPVYGTLSVPNLDTYFSTRAPAATFTFSVTCPAGNTHCGRFVELNDGPTRTLIAVQNFDNRSSFTASFSLPKANHLYTILIATADNYIAGFDVQTY
jgi:hypothetical protein